MNMSPVSKDKRLPDFLIIGTQKGGTTSLYNYLIQHPNILKSTHKEIHFFDKYYNKGVQWYKRQFPLPSEKGKRDITGEATPRYLYDPTVPLKVHKLMPHVKLIVLLRNPVDRAYSNYQMGIYNRMPDLLKKGSTDKFMSFEEVLKTNIGRSYLKKGIYADQLARWMQLFPRNQILIIQSEKFFSNPQATLNQIYRFLGVPVMEAKNLEPYRKGNYEDINPKTREKLLAYFKPHNRRLYRLLNMKYNWGR